MRPTRIAGLAVTLWLTMGLEALAGTASFDPISCGGDLVNVGDSEYDVVQKCGEPSAKQGNRWTYDFGPGQFLQIIVFEQGQVAYFETGARE